MIPGIAPYEGRSDDRSEVRDMPSPKVLTRRQEKQEDPLSRDAKDLARMSGGKAPSATMPFEAKLSVLRESVPEDVRGRYGFLSDVDRFMAWGREQEVYIRSMAGKSYFCFARGNPGAGGNKYVLDSIFNGSHAAKCRDWEKKVQYGIPSVYAHGAPQRATRSEYLKTLQVLYEDAGCTDRIAMAAMELYWSETALRRKLQFRGDDADRGPSLRQVAAMDPKKAMAVIRQSAWMPGLSEDTAEHGPLESDQVRWLVAVCRMRCEMFCGTMRSGDKSMLDDTVYIGHEALDHGARIYYAKVGEQGRYLIKKDEFCSAREYKEQSRKLYRTLGMREGMVELAVMDLYSEFVNDMGVLAAYAKRRVSAKAAGLAFETAKSVPGMEFAGIARTPDKQASGSGMDPEREKLLNELLDERMKAGKAKAGQDAAVKGIAVDSLDTGHARKQVDRRWDE